MSRRVYNKVYSEEVWEKVNPKNKEVLDDFLLDLRENKRSPNTIKQYFIDLRGFLCYLYNYYDNRCVLDLSRKDMKRYALSLVEERDLSNARRNSLVACLHSLLKYAEDDEDWGYEVNAARSIKSLRKEPVKTIVFLEDKTVMDLYSKFMELEKYQEATLLMLSYESAGRRGELAQVTRDSFLDPSRNNTNIVIGKGRKKFSLLYFKSTRNAALEWLNQRGQDDNPDLFVADNIIEGRHKVDPMNIYRMFSSMREYLDLGGKEEDFTPHSMRHSALTNYKNGTHNVCRELGVPGFPIDQLQILAHHDSVNTTQGYLPDVSNEELEKMFGIVIK